MDECVRLYTKTTLFLYIMAVHNHESGVVQHLPDHQSESQYEHPRAANEGDEALLDGLGLLAVGVGVHLASDGNPEAGAQWAAVGLAAVAGPRVLRAYFQAQ